MAFIVQKLSLCALIFVLCSCHVLGQPIFFKVTDFGAVPDGKTDNSEAFMSAWAKACVAHGGGVLVPAGTFLVRTASFEGPCNGETSFQVIGNLVASPDPTLPDGFWLSFNTIDRLRLYGSATFDGQGTFAWPDNKCRKSAKCKLPPVSMKISNMKNSEISGIKLLNSKGFHMHMHGCVNTLLQNLQITAPADSPNTDGIHIAKSNGISVISSKISTGDDCISLGDGNTNININGIACGPGHGISLGSLGKYKDEEDVSGISVTNCTFTKTTNGLRIKTWAPSVTAITVSNVTFENIFVNNVKNPIIIDQHYCPHSHCEAGGESGIAIQDVKFIDIKGTSATEVGVNLECSKVKPCRGIELSGLNIKQAETGEPSVATCVYADRTFVGEDQVPPSC